MNTEKFEYLLANKPDTGDVLETADGSTVFPNVIIDRDTGDIRAHVNAAISDVAEKWVLIEDSKGLKCMLCNDTRKFLSDEGDVEICSLRVLRRSQSGKALICTIQEFMKDGRRVAYSDVWSSEPA